MSSEKKYRLVLLIITYFFITVPIQNIFGNTARELAQVDSLNQLAKKIYYERPRPFKRYPDSMIVYSSKALKIAQLKNYTNGIAEAKTYIGTALMTLGKFAEAKQYSQEALEMVGVEDSIRAEAYRNFGFIYYSIGSYERAYDSLSQALKIGQKIDNQVLIIRSHINAGLSLIKLNMFIEAKSHYQQALNLVEENSKYLSPLYNNLGLLYQEKAKQQRKNKDLVAYDDLHEALKYHFKAIKIKISNKDSTGLANSYTNIGSVYFLLNKLDSAFTYHWKALRIAQKHPIDKADFAGKHINLAHSYLFLGKTDSALFYTKKGLHLAEDAGSKDRMISAYGILANCYEDLGEHELAYEAIRKKLSYWEIVNAKRNSDRAAALKVNQEIELSDKKARIEKAKADREKRRFFIVTIIGGIILIFLGFLAVINHRLKRQKALLKEQKIDIEDQRKILDSLLEKWIQHDVSNDFGFIIRKLTAQGDSQSKNLINQIQIRKLRNHHLRRIGGEQKVPLKPFIKELLNFISSGQDRKDIIIKKEIVDIAVYPSRAQRISMIINELVRNAYKHAFPTKVGGVIIVEIKMEDGFINLLVSDSGNGFSEEIDIDNLTSNGLKDVKKQASDLEGKFEFFSNEYGTQIMVSMINPKSSAKQTV